MSVLKKLRTGLAVSIVGVIGLVALDNLPEDTQVNADIPTPTTIIPAGARTLDPSQARPGLLVTTTTARPVVEEDGPLMVINGREVIYLKRTPLVMQLLWVATKGQG